jgi:hypothetical protein
MKILFLISMTEVCQNVWLCMWTVTIQQTSFVIPMKCCLWFKYFLSSTGAESQRDHKIHLTDSFIGRRGNWGSQWEVQN